MDQNIIADEFVYDRERNGFLITIGFVYFIRLNAWSIEQGGKKLKRKIKLRRVFPISLLPSISRMGGNMKQEMNYQIYILR